MPSSTGSTSTELALSTFILYTLSMIKNEVEVQLEEADQKLAAFLAEFEVLRAKYPEIKFGGISYEMGGGEATAYIEVGEFNIREVSL